MIAAWELIDSEWCCGLWVIRGFLGTICNFLGCPFVELVVVSRGMCGCVPSWSLELEVELSFCAVDGLCDL